MDIRGRIPLQDARPEQALWSGLALAALTCTTGYYFRGYGILKKMARAIWSAAILKVSV